MFGHFLGCFGGAVATLTDREGRRSPTVLSADALCMRSGPAAAARFTHGDARHRNTAIGTIKKHKLMHA